jgi:hypothetical protein
MTVFKYVSDGKREAFKRRFLELYYLDPENENWTSVIDVVNTVIYRERFQAFDQSAMVLVLREMAEAAGLVQEVRGVNPHALDGYFGFVRKE